jgi:hypothetical protein
MQKIQLVNLNYIMIKLIIFFRENTIILHKDTLKINMQ